MTDFFNRWLELRHSVFLQHPFDKTATVPIVLFEILIIGFTLLTLFVFLKKHPNRFKLFGIMAIGIFIFEFFTSPMWNNAKMGVWAYVYQDVSWILTFGWASLILLVVTFVDNFFEKLEEWKRFGVYLILLTFLVVILESILVNLGIRSYSPEAQEVVIGYFFFGTPVAALYYVPVFMSLVIGFYKYWSFKISDRPIVPVIKTRWLRGLLISFIGVFLFEVMIEPMVVNANLPKWSYIYRDVSFLLTGGWIIITWLSIILIDRLCIHLDLFQKFIGYLAVIFILALPCEAWLINHGYRVYGPSTSAAFSGFTVPLFHIPVEVAFGIPFYFALIISFIKYWEIILDNRG